VVGVDGGVAAAVGHGGALVDGVVGEGGVGAVGAPLGGVGVALLDHPPAGVVGVRDRGVGERIDRGQQVVIGVVGHGGDAAAHVGDLREVAAGVGVADGARERA